MNTFGHLIRLTSYGESHGEAVGVILDGVPAGIPVNTDFIQMQLSRRRPGQSGITTPRSEQDELHIGSGVFNDVTTGAPIHLYIKNNDQRSADYDDLQLVYRPSHADFTYQQKYGVRDHRGGGRSSARVTAGWVAGGALVQAWLESNEIRISAYVEQVGSVRSNCTGSYTRSEVDANEVRCPDPVIAETMKDHIKEVRDQGDSVGGVIRIEVEGLPTGMGEPLFGKLNALISHAMFSINAVKGVEFGGGFDMCTKRGSEVNDEFVQESGRTVTTTNNSGGIQGGISNGMPVTFRVGFKPTATIAHEQRTVNQQGEAVELATSGRHDACVVPRAVPIIEAMTALVLGDLYLASKHQQ